MRARTGPPRPDHPPALRCQEVPDTFDDEDDDDEDEDDEESDDEDEEDDDEEEEVWQVGARAGREP